LDEVVGDAGRGVGQAVDRLLGAVEVEEGLAGGGVGVEDDVAGRQAEIAVPLPCGIMLLSAESLMRMPAAPPAVAALMVVLPR
jgi:hypothetical protein